MGKGSEYIALFYMLRRRITLAGLFTIVLLTTTCKQVYAQEPEGTTTLTHSDTGIYQRDITNNGLVKKAVSYTHLYTPQYPVGRSAELW